MMWITPTYSSKMAKNRDILRSRGIFVGRQARALLNAMAYFENERQRGRAGRGPILFPNNGLGRAVGLGRGLPHDRIPIPGIRMPELGVSLPGEEGQISLSLSIPTITPPSTPPQPLGRGFPPSTSPDSPSLEDCSPPRRHQETPLR